ncbi:hypothetical protein DFH06DRAFT_1317305 [Mycena polygramma]|nr:hypothetical protein DFH06DRAFT_1317305 [Mycena polygramma]
MNHNVRAPTFEASWDFTLAQTFDLCVAMLLYGECMCILLVLLSIAAYLLYNWRGPGRSTLAAASAAMAILGTAQIVLQLCATVLGLRLVRIALEGEVWLPKAVHTLNNIYTAQSTFLVTNNLVTDSLFVYRCFAIWGGRARAPLLPALMLLATAVTGYVGLFSPIEYDYRIPFVMAMATNIVLMSLTAGRIWWVRRDASVVLEATHLRKYNTTIAIILECGAIYCVSIILYLICVSLSLPIANILNASLPQMMNIAPMLMIVRVGLGRLEHGQQPLLGVRRSEVVPANTSTREEMGVQGAR